MIYDPFKECERKVQDCSDYELENIGHHTYYRLIHERCMGVGIFGKTNYEHIDIFEKQLEEIKEELSKRNKDLSLS